PRSRPLWPGSASSISAPLRLRRPAFASGYAGVRSASPVWLPDGNSGKPKADAEVPEVRRAPDAVFRGAGPGVADPAAAPLNLPPDALRRGPLRHVAVHVAPPQLVRWVRADSRCSIQVLPLRRLAEGEVAVEVRLLQGQVVGRVVEVEVVRTFF